MRKVEKTPANKEKTMASSVDWFAVQRASNKRGLMATSTTKTTNTIRRGLGPLVAIIRPDKLFISTFLSKSTNNPTNKKTVSKLFESILVTSFFNLRHLVMTVPILFCYRKNWILAYCN
jgi:hypothetical protein